MTDLNKEELLELIHSALGDIHHDLHGSRNQKFVEETTWYQLLRIANSLEELVRILRK